MRQRAVVPAFFGLVTFSLALPPAIGAQGFEITSTLQGARLVTALSSDGISTSLYADSATPTRMSRQFIVRFTDGTAWGIDGESRRFTRTTLAGALERRRAAFAHVSRSKPPVSEVPAMPRRAALRLLPQRASIDGVPLTGFSLRTPDQSWRIWVAMSLPRVPAQYGTALSALVPVDASSASTLAKIVGYPIVRSEIETRSGVVRVLDTKSIKRVPIDAPVFSPPPGFTEMRTASRSVVTPPSVRTASTVRAPAYMWSRTRGLKAFDVPANAIRGPGPEMSNPELYVVFWGKKLNDSANQVTRNELAAAMNDLIKPKYVAPLSQYDIRSATLKGFYRRSDLPPRAVGSSNFAAISAMVYDVGFKDGAPIFWWAVGGHDPLYVLLVTESEVDDAGWSGYHFVAFSLTHAVLPFPASLFAHDAIPWALAKVPDGAFAMPTGARLRRGECNRLALSSPIIPPVLPPICSAIPAFDKGTESISHEVVEAASDPYVFLGWSDPGQQPFYTRSELADLCQFNASPFTGASVVGETMLSTYWSNTDRACMPESRPTLKVFEPAAGQVVSTTTGSIIARGFADDPADGDITNLITWDVDGVRVGKGATIGTAPLSDGNHLLRASIRNSRSLETSVTNSFAVKRPPITLTIATPVDGGTYATNRPFVFRGDALGFDPNGIPESALQWDDNGTVLGTGRLLFKGLATPGPHVIRLSVLGPGGTIGASAQRAINLVESNKNLPSIVITQPASNASFGVASGASTSGPITFSATVTDGTGKVIPATVSWSSDLDGTLGTGSSLTTTLRGGSCAISPHQITATVRSGTRVRMSDRIVLLIGGVC